MNAYPVGMHLGEKGVLKTWDPEVHPLHACWSFVSGVWVCARSLRWLYLVAPVPRTGSSLSLFKGTKTEGGPLHALHALYPPRLEVDIPLRTALLPSELTAIIPPNTHPLPPPPLAAVQTPPLVYSSSLLLHLLTSSCNNLPSRLSPLLSRPRHSFHRQTELTSSSIQHPLILLILIPIALPLTRPTLDSTT